MSSSARRRVLIIVENLSVPFDRRVWRECQALTEAGYRVSVIAPRDAQRQEPSFEELESVSIHRFTPYHATGGTASYILEYLVALISSFRLATKVYFGAGFDVVQICNPPDLLILTVLPFRVLGKRVVFDQHDLCPEIYCAQRGLSSTAGGLMLGMLRFFERLTYRFAHVVLVVNGSCRDVATGRGRVDPKRVFVVRNGPTAESIRTVRAKPGLKGRVKFLLCYVGMMGPQDGIDVMLRAVKELTKLRGVDDFRVRVVGDGTVLVPMKRYSAELGLAELVEFVGRIPHESVLETIATSDVCLCPDPKTPLSDICSLVKVIEYMSLSKPFVAFDLKEVRASAGEAALYAETGTEQEFAAHLNRLLESPALRHSMGAEGARRVLATLTWDRSAAELAKAYNKAFTLG